MDLNELTKLADATSAMYTLPVRRPLENPASKRELMRVYIELGSIASGSQERKLRIAAKIKIFFGPKSC